MSYSVYILTCNDGTYYTGITTDLERRVLEHNTSPLGAKYTKVRRPVSLGYMETCSDKSTALKREYAIKQYSHAEKASLIATFQKNRA